MQDLRDTDEIREAERRRIMLEERRGKTLMGHALAELDDAGGRYATVTPKSVTGAAPGPTYPAQPAGSPWAKDECPPEPLIDGRTEGNTLGYEIDRPDATPTSTALEVKEPPSPPVQVNLAAGGGGRTFRRRA